jgi:hypothetical protein
MYVLIYFFIVCGQLINDLNGFLCSLQFSFNGLSSTSVR